MGRESLSCDKPDLMSRRHAIVRSGFSEVSRKPVMAGSFQKFRSLSDQLVAAVGPGASNTYQIAALKVSNTPHSLGCVSVGLMQNTLYPSLEATIHGWFTQTFSASSCQRRIGSMCSIDGGRSGFMGICLTSDCANIAPSLVSILIIR